MSRSPVSARAPLVVLVAALAATGACRKRAPDEIVYRGANPAAGGGGSTATATAPAPPAPPTLKSQVLAAAADCAVARFRDFEGRARTLRDASRAYALDRSPANAEAAKTAWLTAMKSWQEAEVFRFGPSAPKASPGGQSLRDEIYAWPLVSRCRIEEQIVSLAYAQPSFPTTLATGRTLSAAEYLLFYGGTDNVCSSFSPINANGTWSALGADELGKRKAEYAAAVADDVLARASALARAWDPADGNFRAEVATAGAGSKAFPSDRDALNAISDAMFYVEKEVKDLKVGHPLGVFDCFEGGCADQVESPWARASTAHLRHNLVGFRRLFEGCGDDGAGVAFDDLLRAVGAGELADRMLAALAASRAAVDALDPPLEQALLSDPAKVTALHATIKTLTDPLKTDFVTILDLELPKTSEGDND